MRTKEKRKTYVYFYYGKTFIPFISGKVTITITFTVPLPFLTLPHLSNRSPFLSYDGIDRSSKITWLLTVNSLFNESSKVFHDSVVYRLSTVSRLILTFSYPIPNWFLKERELGVWLLNIISFNFDWSSGFLHHLFPWRSTIYVQTVILALQVLNP